MKIEISDDMLITKIIMTLPVEYRHFVSAWESSADDQRSLVNLTNRLMIEESRMALNDLSLVKAERDEAFLAKQRGSTNKNKNQQKERGNKKRYPRGCCFKCGSSEHYKDKCPENSSNGTNSNKGSIGNNDSGNKALFSNALDFKSESDFWFLDSGASSHMCNRRSWFINYVKFKHERKITLADSNIMVMVGKGDIQVLSYTGGEWIEKTLKNVLHTPRSIYNLFSSTSALDNGHEYWSNKSQFKLLDGNKHGCL